MIWEEMEKINNQKLALDEKYTKVKNSYKSPFKAS